MCLRPGEPDSVQQRGTQTPELLPQPVQPFAVMQTPPGHCELLVHVEIWLQYEFVPQ
jgi:hypothetical protein